MFHLFRDLGEVMDFELDVECSVEPETEASSSKSSSSSLPEVCLNSSWCPPQMSIIAVYSRYVKDETHFAVKLTWIFFCCC